MKTDNILIALIEELWDKTELEVYSIPPNILENKKEIIETISWKIDCFWDEDTTGTPEDSEGYLVSPADLGGIDGIEIEFQTWTDRGSGWEYDVFAYEYKVWDQPILPDYYENDENLPEFSLTIKSSDILQFIRNKKIEMLGL